MAQWEAMFSQLSAEEKAEWNSMSPQERTEMRHELEAEEAEEDRLAESERVSTAAADFKEAKQTTHEPILEGLTDKVLGRGSSNIGNPLGEDAPGYPSDVFPTPVSKEVPKKYSLHPTARLLQQRKELQQQGPVAGAGTKATSAISNIRPDLAATRGLQDERVKGKEGEPIVEETGGSFELDGESLSIGEGGTTTAIDAIDRANAEANALESQTRGLRPEEEESSPLDDIGEKLKNAYDSINNTLSLENLSEMLRNKPVFYAWLKSKGLPMDEYIIKGVRDSIKDAETSIREGIIKPANAVVDANEVVGNKIGEVVGNMKDDESRSTLSQFMGAGPKGYDWLTDPFTDKDPTGEDLEMSDPSYTSTEGEDLATFMPPSPKTTGTKEGHTPHGRPESYDYDKEDYEGKVKTTPKRTEKFISRYKAAKTKKEKEEALPTDKDERAAVKEQADKYWIDPRTGFALNLTEMDRRIDRRSEMEMAALFPAADRAAYLYGKKLIDKEDYERMIKPTEKEEAAALLTKVRTKESLLKIADLELKGKIDPQRKEWVALYKNAVTQDDGVMQEVFGRKLGFSESVLKKSREQSEANARAKFDLKNKGKEFKSNFNVEFSTVIGNKSKWQQRASAVMYGGEDEEFDLGGLGGKPSKFTDRRGYFRSYGLHEQEDALAMSRDKIDKILLKAPMARTFMADPRYAGSDGKFDSSKFVADTPAYERYLMDTLIFEGMSTLYQPGVYLSMMQYQAKHTKTGTFAKKLTNK